jgi:KRAB domain-containing zinc finger protein
LIHLKTVHEGGIKPTYNCSLCDFKSQERSETLKHVKEVHEEKQNSIPSEKHNIPSDFYKCTNCKFTTSDEGVLLKHKMTHIESVHLRKREIFISVHEEEKEAVHEKKKLQNEEETAENRDLLPEKPVFEKAKFEKALRYKCQLCDNTNVYFNEIDELKEHINAIHRTTKPVHEKEEKRFKCSLCESKFSRSNDLRSHISSVHEARDVEAVHEGKKPHQCNICDYKAAKNSDMKRHIQSVHEGANKKSEVENESNESNEDLHENDDLETIKEHDNPEFMCKICGKDFAGPATLKVGFFLSR